MKKIIILFVVVFSIFKIQGQNYFEIIFNGLNANLTSVKVENLTQETSINIDGNDTLFLHLTGLGIQNIESLDNRLKIYPNPMESSCNFEFSIYQPDDIIIQIFSIDGKLIYNYRKSIQLGVHHFLLTGVPLGFYILGIKTKTNNITGHIVSMSQSNAPISIIYINESNQIQFEKISNQNRIIEMRLTEMNTIQNSDFLDFVLGDQLKFIGFANGFINDTVYGSPTGNQTIDFVFMEPPTVITTITTSITQTTAISGGEITSDGGGAITDRGVCWSTNNNPTISNSHISNGIGMGTYTCNISGLIPLITYYVRAYAINNSGVSYGNEVSFTTLSVPIISTSPIINITSNSALGGGNVIHDGGLSLLSRGVCWSTTSNPTINDTVSIEGNTTGSFTSSLTGLQPGTTYYVKAYAVNSEGVGYGSQTSFITNPTLPQITTTNISSITSNSAFSGGNVIYNGGTSIIARGVCWSTSENPSLIDSITHDGPGMGTFASNISGLEPGVTYYVRAYATNSVGTSYGNQIEFTTTATYPSLTTLNASSITSFSAYSGGVITSYGGTSILSKGICWSIFQTPSINDSIIVDLTPSDTFNSLIIGLLPGTTYYVRAYASNSVGVSYGNEISFTTPLSIPILSTHAIFNITSTSAISGGTVLNNGGSPVLVKGICWSTSQNPTILNDTSIIINNNNESFLSFLPDLYNGMTYYVKSYAINNIGIGYGEQQIFNTLIPVVYDIDGNGYDTIVIGSQVWLKQNLRTTKLRDTTIIPNIVDSLNWLNATSSGYCWYKNDSLTYSVYGILYNWHAVNSLKLCPTGWHEPSNVEWQILSNYLGGNSISGGKLKEIESFHWIANNGANNSSGFTALPSGYRNKYGTFLDLGYYGYWWTKTSGNTSTSALRMWLNHNNEVLNYNIYSQYEQIKAGLSVRCLRNELPVLTTNTISALTPNSVISGGNISYDGGVNVLSRGVCWDTLPNPTVDNFKTIEGTGTGVFISVVPYLNPNTTYYLRAYAINSTGASYGSELIFTTLPTSPLVFDFDANTYDTIHIGSQIWLKQNLKTSRFRNGKPILNATNAMLWGNTSSPSYCIYNDSIANDSTYGKLYNWYSAADTNKICPINYHVPTVSEWNTFISILGDSTIAGGKLKDFQSGLWNLPNTGANNESNFSALPAGSRYDDASYNDIGNNCFWWSAFENNSDLGRYYWLSYNNSIIKNNQINKSYGFSIRCISNFSAVPPSIDTTLLATITSTTATVGGYVSSSGGLPVYKGITWSLTPNPVYAGNRIEFGIDTGLFYCDIIRLTPNTTYYVRSYAINDVGITYGNEIIFITTTPVVYDIEGNGYDTVHIGSQIWLKQNLKTKKFRNGDPITLVNTSWSNVNTEAYCLLNADTNLAHIYGVIYNGYAILDTRLICPEGWHVPSDLEWSILDNNLGAPTLVGGKLKESGFSHWKSPNTGATNESGFTALPGGGKNILYMPQYLQGGYWWTSTSQNSTTIWTRRLTNTSATLFSSTSDKRYGFSVRCVKD
jgi:uncharacterized protein (TIGR02145 family)